MATVDSPKLIDAAAIGQHVANAAVLSHRYRFERVITNIEILADFITVLSCLLFSSVLYVYLGIGKRLHYGPNKLVFGAAAFTLLFVFLMERDGGYRSANSLLRIRETERVLRVSAIAFTFLFLSTVLVDHLVSRAMLLLAFVIVPLAVSVEKQIIYSFVRVLRARGHGIQNVLIYGAGETGRRLYSALERSPKLGLRPVAIVDDNRELAGSFVRESGYRHKHLLVVTRGPVTRDLIHEADARLVIVAIPSISAVQLKKLSEEAFSVQAALAFVPHLGHGLEAVTPEYADIDGILIASLLPPPQQPWYDFSKRVFDLITAGVLMLMTIPLWVLIALLIKLDSPGPIFFEQARVGRNGSLFNLLKFRSMYVYTPKYGYHPIGAHDPRITGAGKWLRRTSLDELPQLLNVLRGDMSLVGPRPEMPFIVDCYGTRERQRLQIMPGITGLWQISADRAFLIHENLQYDLYYIRNRNFFMDLALLLHTVVFAVRGI